MAVKTRICRRLPPRMLHHLRPSASGAWPSEQLSLVLLHPAKWYTVPLLIGALSRATPLACTRLEIDP